METEYITPTKLQFMNKKELRALKKILIVRPLHSTELIAAVVPYAQFLTMQSLIIKFSEEAEGAHDAGN